MSKRLTHSEGYQDAKIVLDAPIGGQQKATYRRRQRPMPPTEQHLGDFAKSTTIAYDDDRADKTLAHW
jgi:hypothetical protein